MERSDMKVLDQVQLAGLGFETRRGSLSSFSLFPITASKSTVIEKLCQKSMTIARCRKSNRKKVKKYFTALYNTNDDGIAYALIIAAHLKNLSIVFDFEYSTLEGMIGPKGRQYNGIFYRNKCLILIGAKRDRNLVEASLIHELMHCVFYKVYMNDCLPYAKDDALIKNYYQFLLEKYQHYEQDLSIEDDCKGIISTVYRCYKGIHQQQELIVRPPQMIATFCGKRTTIAHLKVEYEDLFTYYNITVTSELKTFIEKYL